MKARYTAVHKLHKTTKFVASGFHSFEIVGTIETTVVPSELEEYAVLFDFYVSFHSYTALHTLFATSIS